MRLLLFAGLLLCSLACSTPKKASMTPNPLNGTWIPFSEEFGGMPLPPAAFARQRLQLSDSTYTMNAESEDKGTVTTNGNKMDIYGKEGVNAGKQFTAIWKFENDILTICYNLAGTGYPESFTTKGQAMYFMAIFRKEK